MPSAVLKVALARCYWLMTSRCEVNPRRHSILSATAAAPPAATPSAGLPRRRPSGLTSVLCVRYTVGR